MPLSLPLRMPLSLPLSKVSFSRHVYLALAYQATPDEQASPGLGFFQWCYYPTEASSTKWTPTSCRFEEYLWTKIRNNEEKYLVEVSDISDEWDREREREGVGRGRRRRESEYLKLKVLQIICVDIHYNTRGLWLWANLLFAQTNFSTCWKWCSWL